MNQIIEQQKPQETSNRYDKRIIELKKEIKRKNSIIKSLHETVIGLINHRRVDELLRDILKRAAQLSRTPHGYIYLLDQKTNTMAMTIGVGMYEASRVYHLGKGEGFGGRIWQIEKTMAVDDYASWPHRLTDDLWNSTHAIIGTPLKSSSEVVGIIVLSCSNLAQRFSREDVVELGKFAELASVVLENARLYETLEKELQERRQAEAELHVSTERLRAVIECAKDYIYVKDCNLRYKDINPAMVALIDKPFSEIIGKTDFEVFDADTAELLRKTDEAMLAGKNVDDTELHVRINNQDRILNRIVAPLREKSGAIIGICGIVRDITERKRSEATISQAKEAVEKAQRMASLGVMSAGITHEINQPLNCIKVNASGLLYLYKKGEMPEASEIMGDIREICAHAERIEEIIRHMRSFIQNRNRPDINEFQTCNIINATELSLDLVRSQLNSRGIAFRLEVGTDEQELNVNATMTGLEGIIVNILANAIEALGATEKKHKKITISASLKNKAVCLEISDNGPGISQEDIDNIFDPFFSTKTKSRNIGLGLAIVQMLVRSFDGKIAISNGKKCGTKVTIEFPQDVRVG